MAVGYRSTGAVGYRAGLLTEGTTDHNDVLYITILSLQCGRRVHAACFPSMSRVLFYSIYEYIFKDLYICLNSFRVIDRTSTFGLILPFKSCIR